MARTPTRGTMIEGPDRWRRCRVGARNSQTGRAPISGEGTGATVPVERGDNDLQVAARSNAASYELTDAIGVGESGDPLVAT